MFGQVLPRNEASPGCLARYYRGMTPLRDVWPGTIRHIYYQRILFLLDYIPKSSITILQCSTKLYFNLK